MVSDFVLFQMEHLEIFMLPEILIQEIQNLKSEGFAIELIDAEGFANALFHKYPIPYQYNKPETELLLRLPTSYPNGKPDMFWTDVNLLLRDGKIPNRADQIESYLGRQWRRFSWHLSVWNPSADNLKMFLEFINSGLIKAAK